MRSARPRPGSVAAVFPVLVVFLSVALLQQGSASAAWRHRGRLPQGPSRVQTVAVGAYPHALAVDARTGRAFVQAGFGPDLISTIDVAGARVVRAVRTSAGRGIALTVDAPTKRVFVLDSKISATNGSGRTTSQMIVLDGATGAILHVSASTGVPLLVDPSTGHVFVIDSDVRRRRATVSMLDGTTGAVLRTLTLPAIVGAVAIDAQRERVYVDGFRAGCIYVVDALTDTLVAQVRIDKGSAWPDALAVDKSTGRIFIGETSATYGAPTLHVIDVSRHAAIQSISLKLKTCIGNIVQSMAADTRSGRIFVACGALVVLDARTAAVVATVNPGAVITSIAIDAARGRVFVTHFDHVDSSYAPNGLGSVTVHDALSGRILRRVVTGWGPIAVAVDQRDSRVLVLNVRASALANTTQAIRGTVTIFDE